MATRYDQKTKDEVIAFIQEYNEEHGRGGQSAAAKKWNLNPITIKSWMEKAGVKTPGKTAKKKRGGRRKAKTATTRPAKKVGRRGGGSSAGTVPATLERMIDIQKQMEGLQKEYDKLKSQL